MLSRFLKSRSSTPRRGSTVPDGQRVYAIGDIHGCRALLDRLVAQIDADDADRGPAATTIVLLGDLVDRGPDSAGVIDTVGRMIAARPDVRLILGNHEEVFLDAIDGDATALRLFCRIGGRETALSYGIAPDAYDAMNFEELSAALREVVPEAHRETLAQAGDMAQIGDYAFVHAGVRPGRALADQTVSDLRWIRESFLSHRDAFEKIVVHGHTVTEAVDVRPNRIGIDTGAYMSGRLTALGLEGGERWFLATD